MSLISTSWWLCSNKMLVFTSWSRTQVWRQWNRRLVLGSSHVSVFGWSLLRLCYWRIRLQNNGDMCQRVFTNSSKVLLNQIHQSQLQFASWAWHWRLCRCQASFWLLFRRYHRLLQAFHPSRLWFEFEQFPNPWRMQRTMCSWFALPRPNEGTSASWCFPRRTSTTSWK